MTKKDWHRALMHLPVGAVAGLLTLVHPSGGIALFSGELVYELFNDWRKKDSSYKDVLGIVWGYGLALTAGLIVKGMLLGG